MTDLVFNASPAELIGTYIETLSPATLAEIHRDLALHRSVSYDRNATQLGKLFVAFRAGLALLAVEICAWIVALSGQG